MRIFVVTYGRVGNQVTWSNLPPSVREKTTLLVDAREAESHGDIPVTVLPPEIQGIGACRQWMIDNSEDKVLMLDDDLTFYVRRDDDRKLLREPTEGEIEHEFAVVEAMLDRYALVGTAAREGANRQVARLFYNTRILRMLGYRADWLRDEGIRFDRVPVMEDFDVALQLLRKGYMNVVVNDYAHNQKGSGLEGGCSTYRTMDVQAEAARKLSELHPGLVTVVTKETKTAWGGGVRTDVIVKWKEAYASSNIELNMIAEEHDGHGTGSAEAGPDAADCPCRATDDRLICGYVGCGFCRAP